MKLTHNSAVFFSVLRRHSYKGKHINKYMIDITGTWGQRQQQHIQELQHNTENYEVSTKPDRNIKA